MIKLIVSDLDGTLLQENHLMNQETIDEIKKQVAIWNINSFAEFYMQIEEKYKKDYETLSGTMGKSGSERSTYASLLALAFS